MAQLKTRKTKKSVDAFLKGVADEKRRGDCLAVAKIMQEATGAKPVMWGDSIVGFGSYHYRYASGREGDWFLAGFSPRRQNLALDILSGFDRYADRMKTLGKCKTGNACLYVSRLDDIDPATLKKLVTLSVGQLKKTRA